MWCSMPIFQTLQCPVSICYQDHATLNFKALYWGTQYVADNYGFSSIEISTSIADDENVCY